MDVSHALPVNHHADHPGFSGVTGLLFALIFLAIGRPKARLAVEVAGVSDGDRVVDIGCGPGSAVRQAARRGARVTGVDPSSAMLRVARAFTRHATGIEWAEGTAENVPVPDGSATVVWSLATVHHWHDLDAGLDEVRRVLRPAGRFLAVERRTVPGATGLASHGWTDEQADLFAERCRSVGFTDVAVDRHRSGRRQVLSVLAHAA